MPHYSTRNVTASDSIPKLGISIPAQQAFFYGTWHERVGRTVHRFLISKDSTVVGSLQLITFPLARGYSLLYAPYGPVLIDTSPELLLTVARAISEVANKERAVFARIDPTATLPLERGTLARAGFLRPKRSTLHASAFQPAYEWLLDITPSEETLLSGMDKKHRYSLRTADEHQVQTRIVTADATTHIDTFMALMRETAERDGFSLHPRAYYEAALKSVADGHGYLTIATVENIPAVINVMITEGTVAHLFFSGSTSAHRSTMASYTAQWASIRHAKQIGMDTYNFGGVSGPTDERYEGITRYKKRFGGHLLTHEHPADLVQYRILYELYALRRSLNS